MILRFFDTLIFGWHVVLKNTMYNDETESGFGSKEHSFLLSYFVLTWIANSAIDYVLVSLFSIVLNWPLGLLLDCVIALVLYYVYFINGRISNVVSSSPPLMKQVAYALFAMVFSVIAVIGLYHLDNRIRDQYLGLEKEITKTSYNWNQGSGYS